MRGTKFLSLSEVRVIESCRWCLLDRRVVLWRSVLSSWFKNSITIESSLEGSDVTGHHHIIIIILLIEWFASYRTTWHDTKLPRA